MLTNSSKSFCSVLRACSLSVGVLRTASVHRAEYRYSSCCILCTAGGRTMDLLTFVLAIVTFNV
jgi:hypothetical protein